MRAFFSSFCVIYCLINAIPAFSLDVAYQIGTVAGSDWIGDGAAATRALLIQAEGIAVDPNGNLYIADAANHRVRKVTRAGTISTFAGTGIAGFSGDGGPAAGAQLNAPYGLAYDARGNLYIADLGNARVRRVGVDGAITTIAGGGLVPAGGANEGSLGTFVSLTAPRNLALDGYGSIYISDFGANCVYRLSQEGSLTTVAGSGTHGFSGDGMAATRAQLYYPTAIAIDRQGAMYIADSQNHLIRKVVNGVISSIARAATPTGLAIDTFGTLYVADRSAGEILTFPVGGRATALNLGARDLAFGPDGYLYAADGAVVRRVSFSGPSTVVAGGATLASGDMGDATLARLNHPSGVTADASGNIYIADRDNHRIRRVGVDGIITTIAGTGDAGDSGDGGLAVKAQLNSPSAVTVDAGGNLYIADSGNHRIREVTAAGVILPIGAGAGFISPAYALADSAGNVYISDSEAGAIFKITPAGTLTTVLARLQEPRGLAFDAVGNLYFTEVAGKRVQRLGLRGDVVNLGPGVWSAPEAVAVSGTGDVLVADMGRQQILRVSSSSDVTPVAGDASAGFAGDGKAASYAKLSSPWDIAAGPAGTFYIADLDNNRIRWLIPGPDVIADPILLVLAVNAASLQPGPVAPGMLMKLLDTGLGAGDLPDTQILFGTVSAPVLSLNDSGLVVQAPIQIAGAQDVQITILHQGNPRAQITSAVIDAAPALFADASGQAAANNEDGTLNSTANPIAQGSVIVLYGTGEGVSGLPVLVNIGNIPAEVLYAGPVAGFPGLLQINARVPASYVAPGTMAVTIAVGQASSQAGVTIAVK